MFKRARGRFPSPTFAGTLLGIGCGVLVPPRMMLSPNAVIPWLLAWSAVGFFAGIFVEAILVQTRKRGAGPSK